MAGMTKLPSTVRQKTFGETCFRKTHFSCQLWTLGWKQWHPENNYRQGCWRCTVYVQGNEFKILFFSRWNFHFSILLRFLDFRLFAAEKRLFFFFGEVISTRLLKVYSRCSEEHFRGKKLIFCEKLLIFAVFRLWNLWKFFRRHFLLLRKFQKKCQHWFIRVELNVQVEKMFFFDRPMCL